jgi:hypothetical protein
MASENMHLLGEGKAMVLVIVRERGADLAGQGCEQARPFLLVMVGDQEALAGSPTAGCARSRRRRGTAQSSRGS